MLSIINNVIHYERIVIGGKIKKRKRKVSAWKTKATVLFF